MNQAKSGSFSKWGPTVKLVVIQSYMIILVVILVVFRDYVGPLILSLILFYIFRPISEKISKLTKLKWRLSVGLVFVVFSLSLASLFAAVAVVILQQIQNGLHFLTGIIADLPNIVYHLTTESYGLGPFQFSLKNVDLLLITEPLLGFIDLSLKRIGVEVGKVFAGTVSTIFWMFFIFQVSFILLSSIAGESNSIFRLQIPGHEEDLDQLSKKLRWIWRTYLRGQLTKVLILSFLYSITFYIIGLRSAVFLAILAGLSRYVPYIGKPYVWILVIMSAAFQTKGNIGLEGLAFVVVVLALVSGN